MSSPYNINDDSFVNVWVDKGDDAQHGHHPKDFYAAWNGKASGEFTDHVLIGADALRRLYPKHNLVMTSDWQINILSFPGLQAEPLEKTPMITNLFFVPFARRLGKVPGVLVDQVRFGAFTVTWQEYSFLLFCVLISNGISSFIQYYLLHEGPEDPARLLLLTVGAWGGQLHDEIWVYNQGFWSKDHGLWTEVQKANWDDVILKEPFKKALQKDVYGFFSSEEVYRKLAIPWKRGLILHGPPGNGKTISLKAIMKACGDKGFAPLYVRSFQSWKGEEGAMAEVFDKARQLSPCILVFEDLDSLINDRNRSFFLNQMDGLESNDGLLIIGTTNHFDRLDPGLSTRPSRFDRKYLFSDPDCDERVLYAKYWQDKLKDNDEIEYPDTLVYEVADTTARFSFAYLKEAFVSSLVILATYEGTKPTFTSVLKDQISSLRKQLDKANHNAMPGDQSPGEPSERSIKSLFDSLSDVSARSENRPRVPRTMSKDTSGGFTPTHDLDHFLRELSNNLKPGVNQKIFDIAPPGPSVQARVPPSIEYPSRPVFPDPYMFFEPTLYQQRTGPFPN